MAANLNRESLIARLRKVLALAKNGVGGERENAERQLNAMLVKYGFTMADIDEDVQDEVAMEFDFANDHERALITQVVGKVLNKFGTDFYIRKHGGRKVKNRVHAYMTKAQAVECEIYYTVLRKALSDHIVIAYRAFIQKNEVFPDAPADPKELTPEKRAELMKVMSMMSGMDKTQVVAQIGQVQDAE